MGIASLMGGICLISSSTSSVTLTVMFPPLRSAHPFCQNLTHLRPQYFNRSSARQKLCRLAKGSLKTSLQPSVDGTISSGFYLQAHARIDFLARGSDYPRNHLHLRTCLYLPWRKTGLSRPSFPTTVSGRIGDLLQLLLSLGVT